MSNTPNYKELISKTLLAAKRFFFGGKDKKTWDEMRIRYNITIKGKFIKSHNAIYRTLNEGVKPDWLLKTICHEIPKISGMDRVVIIKDLDQTTLRETCALWKREHPEEIASCINTAEDRIMENIIILGENQPRIPELIESVPEGQGFIEEDCPLGENYRLSGEEMVILMEQKNLADHGISPHDLMMSELRDRDPRAYLRAWMKKHLPKIKPSGAEVEIVDENNQ